MPEIILTKEQASVLLESRESVILRDEGGTVRIVSEPYDAVALAKHHQRKLSGNFRGGEESVLSPEELSELKRRAASPGPWFTGKQVFCRLEALQAEWERTGGFDETYMHDFLQQLDSSDPGHMRSGGASA